jgi:hypothetical protein
MMGFPPSPFRRITARTFPMIVSIRFTVLLTEFGSIVNGCTEITSK